MAVKIDRELRDGYALVRFDGQESYEDALCFWKELLQESEVRDEKYFLVVGEPKKPLTPYEVQMLCLEIARMGKGKTIAYVDPHREDYGANMAGEKVAVNRGMNTQVFTSEKDAKEWLELHRENQPG